MIFVQIVLFIALFNLVLISKANWLLKYLFRILILFLLHQLVIRLATHEEWLTLMFSELRRISASLLGKESRIYDVVIRPVFLKELLIIQKVIAWKYPFEKAPSFKLVLSIFECRSFILRKV